MILVLQPIPFDARWAVFFDEMGITWSYQVEGFALKGRLVQPDFWLPHYDCFWEVRLTPKLDLDEFGTWAATANKPVLVSTRMPHYCGAMTPAQLIVIGFPCVEPAAWPGPDRELPNLALRQRIAEATGRTWVSSGSRLPAVCPACQLPVLLWFDPETTSATCPSCQWTGIPASLLPRLGVAGDTAEAFTF